MNHIRYHHVESIEDRQDEYHGESRDTDAYYRNPGDDIDKIVTLLCQQIALRYERREFQLTINS